jgi:hypothetical protein
LADGKTAKNSKGTAREQQQEQQTYWDIEFRKGDSLLVISQSLREYYDFVFVNDALVVFSPDEILRRVALDEHWWNADH